MAKEKKPRFPIQVRCETEEERQALHNVAANRKMDFSAMVRLDYLQKQPTVTYATPERKRLIEAIAKLSQVVTFLNAINPRDDHQRQSIDSAIQGALLFFNQIQSELNDNKG